jgi:hypothetical protein
LKSFQQLRKLKMYENATQPAPLKKENKNLKKTYIPP